MKALDLFCGGGGTALGLIEAGFEVTGVDADPRHAKIYPGTFICGEIDEFKGLQADVDPMDFDFIWASPPCQRYSRGTPALYRQIYPDLIPITRDILRPHPFTCIENVPPAPIRADLQLTGPTVGLMRIERLRRFELSWALLWYIPQPIIRHVPMADFINGIAVTITKSMSASSHYYARKRRGLSGRVGIVEGRECMGVSTRMTTYQLGESVPPAYSSYIGTHAMRVIKETREGNHGHTRRYRGAQPYSGTGQAIHL